jgi:hypothetical protein
LQKLLSMAFTIILGLVKYLLFAAVIYVCIRMVVQAFLKNEEKKREAKNKSTVDLSTLPLKLQACERLILLLERISPAQAINRVLQPGMTSNELHISLLQSIREEYEHNIAQQIYISPGSWALLRSAKEEIVFLINTAAAQTEGGTGSDLARKALELWGQKEKNPLQDAIDQLKTELRPYL